MTPNEINGFLTLAKISIQELADDLGYSRVEVSQAINGLRKNPKIREAIASKFGMTVDRFFGRDHELATQARKELAA
jgi:hypothetical protein